MVYVYVLGVLINSHPTWKYHISHVTSMISRHIGIIARLRHFTLSSTLAHVYRSLIYPYLSYGLGPSCSIPSRDNFSAPKKSNSSDELCQIRNSCGIPYLISSNIMPISMLYFKLSSVPMRDISNDSAPPTINGKFISSSQVQHYNTRSPSTGNFYRRCSRLNTHKNSFASLVAKNLE